MNEIAKNISAYLVAADPRSMSSDCSFFIFESAENNFRIS